MGFLMSLAKSFEQAYRAQKRQEEAEKKRKIKNAERARIKQAKEEERERAKQIKVAEREKVKKIKEEEKIQRKIESEIAKKEGSGSKSVKSFKFMEKGNTNSLKNEIQENNTAIHEELSEKINFFIQHGKSKELLEIINNSIGHKSNITSQPATNVGHDCNVDKYLARHLRKHKQSK